MTFQERASLRLGDFRRKFRTQPSPKEVMEKNDIVLSGAYGGVVPRIFPTNVNQVFTKQGGRGGQISTGIRQPMALRPPSAAMLGSADYHSNASVSGRTLNMPTVPFTRKSIDQIPAAVTDATHLSGVVHPTVKRKVRRGQEAL